VLLLLPEQADLPIADSAIPWHLSQYYPAYRMREHPPTLVETLRRTCDIGRKASLPYVYEGNGPSEGGENTPCYQRGALLIERHGLFVRQNRIRNGACPEGGTARST
jgi:pyruvate formate lyase activating enzyme